MLNSSASSISAGSKASTFSPGKSFLSAVKCVETEVEVLQTDGRLLFIFFGYNCSTVLCVW